MSRPAQGVGTGYDNALISKLKQNEVAQMPMKNRLLEAQTQASELTAEDAQYLNNFRDMAVDNRKLSAMLDAGDYMGAESLLSQRAARLQEQKIDNSDTMKGLEMLRGGNIDQLRSQSQLIEQTANDLGIFGGGAGVPTEIQTFNTLTSAANATDEERERAARIALHLEGKPTEAITLAQDPYLASLVAQSKGQIAGAVSGQSELSKLLAQSNLAPDVQAKIQEAVKNVDLEMNPQIERASVEAREKASARIQKMLSQETQSGKITEVDEITNSLLKPKNGKPDMKLLSKIYGKGESFYPDILRSQEGVDGIRKVGKLVGILKLGARGELKGQGPITDADQNLLGQSISILEDLEISPELAASEIQRAVEVMYRSAGKQGGGAGRAGAAAVSPQAQRNSFTSKSGVTFTVDE
jgi:hypothetical protein